jgi:DNA (cytosine-5)-methyltransferase 1
VSGPRIGSLCSGYGGLDLAVQSVFGGGAAWVSDIDKGARKILAHRYPSVPNLGDFTKTDWSTVEPVDILTAGFPCQPVSNAGKRLGDNDERWLWDDVARAVGELRPGLVVLENVRGLLTAGSGRLFGRVLGSLAALGYDAQWHGLRAADVGAPHGRWRVFIVAADASGQRWTGCHESRPVVEYDGSQLAHTGQVGRTLFPTPRATDGTKGGPGQRGSSGDLMLPSAVALLPTPAVNDMGEGKTVERWDEWTADMQAKHGNGNGHGKSLAIEAQRLLPTPEASRAGGTAEQHLARKKAADGATRSVCTNLDIVATDQTTQWGDYAAAIARWEHILGRPAPEPTQTSSKGNPQLSAAFVEWLMGVPEGWVTDVPGITRNEALKALGNGVVPAQCAAALRLMASWEAVA